MIQIRPGVFETNSSSTHSICIATDRRETLDIPTELTFSCREFGWKRDTLVTASEKASYLYSAMLVLFDREEVAELTRTIMDTLASEGVTCDFEEPEYATYSYGSGEYCTNAGIDHPEGDLYRFVDGTVHNKGRLLRFLFTPKSFILTGNDNDDYDVDIHVDYPHEEYYKGN